MKNTGYVYANKALESAVRDLKSSFFDIFYHSQGTLLMLMKQLDELEVDSEELKEEAVDLINAQGTLLSDSMVLVEQLIRSIKMIDNNGKKIDKFNRNYVINRGKNFMKMDNKSNVAPVQAEATTEAKTEAVVVPVAEATSEVATEAATEAQTETVVAPAVEETSEVTTEAATEAQTEIVVAPVVEATSEVTTEATSEVATEATSEVATEVTTEIATEAVVVPVIEATSEVATEAATEAQTEAVVVPAVEATSEVTTEATTEAQTEAVVVPVVEATSEVTTEATTETQTEAVVAPVVEATSDVITEAATEAQTEAVVVPAVEATSEVTTEATTEVQTEAVVVPAVEATSEVATEAATEAQTEAVVVPAVEATSEVTTEASTEVSTVATGLEIDPNAPVEPLTEPPTEKNKKYISDTPEAVTKDLKQALLMMPGMENLKFDTNGKPDFSSVLPPEVLEQFSTKFGFQATVKKSLGDMEGDIGDANIVTPAELPFAIEPTPAPPAPPSTNAVNQTEITTEAELTTEVATEAQTEAVVAPEVEATSEVTTEAILEVATEVTTEIATEAVVAEATTEETPELSIPGVQVAMPTEGVVAEVNQDLPFGEVATEAETENVTEATTEAQTEDMVRKFTDQSVNVKAILVSDSQYNKLVGSRVTQEALLTFKRILPEKGHSGTHMITVDTTHAAVPSTENMTAEDKNRTIEAMMADANNLYNAGKIAEAQALYDKISEINKTLVKS